MSTCKMILDWEYEVVTHREPQKIYKLSIQIGEEWKDQKYTIAYFQNHRDYAVSESERLSQESGIVLEMFID